jgi:hypothetical protein
MAEYLGLKNILTADVPKAAALLPVGQADFFRKGTENRKRWRDE